MHHWLLRTEDKGWCTGEGVDIEEACPGKGGGGYVTVKAREQIVRSSWPKNQNVVFASSRPGPLPPTIETPKPCTRGPLSRNRCRAPHIALWWVHDWVLVVTSVRDSYPFLITWYLCCREAAPLSSHTRSIMQGSDSKYNIKADIGRRH